MMDVDAAAVAEEEDYKCLGRFLTKCYFFQRQ